MTDEQINIAIAESLGWRSKSGAKGGIKWVDKNGNGKDGGGLYGYGYNDELKSSDLPNYASDLNAIHEAEALIIKLGHRAIRTYEDILQKQIANIVFATARQRCEAYLRTIGKWKEQNE